MDLIIDGITQAIHLIISLDKEIIEITILSLKISMSATFISLVFGISCGTALALADFPGKKLFITLVNTGMGMPPVVAGLAVTIILWRNGPLGFFEILYTPAAMVIAQTVIAAPIITGITFAAVQNIPEKMKLQILALGATKTQMIWMLVREARLPMLAGVMAGFGGVISEIGASIMVGGNIRGYTRVLTTATVMETGKGSFDIAIALSIILLLLIFSVNYILTSIQQKGKKNVR